MSALYELAEAIAKAGLIKPGKPHLLKRVAFLLSSGSSERNYQVGRYLKRRKRGGTIPGSRRKRVGAYTGVYKSEDGMTAIDELAEAIEKAGKGLIRGGSRATYDRIQRKTQDAFETVKDPGMNNYRRRKAEYSSGPKREGLERQSRALSYLSHRQRRVKKSAAQKETPMTAIDDLNDAIDIAKARGLIPRGGSSKMARRVAQQGARAQAKGGDPKAAKRFSALGTLDNRKKGRAIGLGYNEKGGYKSLTRRGKYK